MKEPKIEEDTFQYKGFNIRIGYDNSIGLYYGKILKNDSSIAAIFREKKKEVLDEKFREAIDDYYINFCDGKYPEDDFSFVENPNTSLINSIHGGIKYDEYDR